ncbi:MAG: hypothetical protein R2910_13205 [Gemmatimonadales bacterium]
MKRRAVVFASAIVAACGSKEPKLAEPIVTTLPNGAVEVQNSGPSAWVDTMGWKLVEVYRVGGSTATGPEELVHPLSVAVDQAGGIYVGNMGPAVVKQFGPTGAYVRSIGREGSGPGEFKVSFVATAPGLLVVHDPGTARTSVFDSAGGFLRSWNSACCSWRAIGVSREGVIAVPSLGHRTGPGDRGDAYYVRNSLDGTLVDTLHIAGPEGVGEPGRWSFESANGNQYFVPVPLTSAVSMALDPAGGAVMGWSGAYRFVVTRTGLDTTQVVILEASPVTVTDAQRIHLRDSLVELYSDGEADRQATEEAFKLADIPSTAPYFESIAVDGSGNRWVRRIGGTGPGSARFDVFDSTGSYLGAVPVPVEFGAAWKTAWGTDRVATMVEDKDGFPVVVVYGIEKP